MQAATKLYVLKIGGSTLGSHDTTLDDLVQLQRQGKQVVVVHGGGKVISEWMERQGARPRFVRGLRVTDAASLQVVTAVLTGLVNKELVASLNAKGARAVGLSGVDGAILQARVQDTELGYVGQVVRVNPTPIRDLLSTGYMPVVAPVGVQYPENGVSAEQLLNINGDTAAGELAVALDAGSLVFLTDVEGVLDSSGRLIPRIPIRQGWALLESGVIGGGMGPKLEACLRAAEHGVYTRIVDGRRQGALLESLSGEAVGTRIG
ncbi:MAG: acetylglutamate kinase [Chloroflexi bacterium]|nr:acetylglutamate kinase [Chloroflexota bacterium]